MGKRLAVIRIQEAIRIIRLSLPRLIALFRVL